MGISGASVIRIELNDRGDPAAFDVTEATMTMDNTWQNLDLSAIVPADAAWILLRVNASCGNSDSDLYFRKDGNANAIATPGLKIQVSNFLLEAELLVACSAARIIEYKANRVFNSINIVVLGWINGA